MELTGHRLDDIRTKQSNETNPWPANSGYLDYVKDDRSENYWRAYVGQSAKPWQRIAQHIRCILQLQHDTSHYYVIWKGNAYRSANFILL